MIKAGKQYVVGGREFPISDHGGGAILGLSLIQRVLWAHDGILEKTELVNAVLTHFNHDIDAIVAWSKTARPCDYGQFSPQIFDFAEKGDFIAKELLQETANYVEMWLSALQKKGANKICLMGGIGKRITPWLSHSSQALLASPQGDAMTGALQMAKTSGHNLY